MAYKFQLGSATLSGSLTQEGNVVASGGNLVADGGIITGSSNLMVGGTVRLDGVADATADLAADSFYFLDGDGLMKRERMSDYASSAAGDGLKSFNGAFALDLNELSAAAVNVGADSIAIVDADDNLSKKESIADLMTAAAGDGLAASSGVLAVQVSGAAVLASDKVGISGSIAGPGLKYNGGVNSISDLEIDMSEFSAVTPAASDSFLTLDSDGSTEQRTTTDALATLFAGDGLAAASAVMKLDLNELTAATVDVANDSLAIVDANDSNATRKESISDLVNAMVASTDGLQASSGVISVNANSTSFEFDAGELQLKASVAGDGLVLSSESLAVQVSGAVKIASDKVGLSGSLAGPGLKYNGGVDSISDIEIDMSEFSSVTPASGDSFLTLDSDGGTEQRTTTDALATLMAGNGLSAASAVMALDLNELTAAAVDVGNDSIAIIDANDSNATKKESIADIMTAAAGDALAASAGVLAVQVNSTSLQISSDEIQLKNTIVANNGGLALDSHALKMSGSAIADGAVAVNGDEFMFIDADGSIKRDTMADYATAIAGDGLAASAGVLAVQVSGAVVLDSDKIGLSGSFAGPGLKYNGGVDSISDIEIDMSEFSAVTPAASDSFMTLDSDGSTEQLTTTDALATLFAGNGLSAASAVMALDLNELSAAAVDVANDSIAIIDANDSNGSKKESIADLVTGMAGSGLTATSGVLSVTANNVSLKADGDTLVEGYNYFATVSGASTVTLPASPSVGDVVTLKAKDGVTQTNYIQINRAGSQTIDGQTSVKIESPYGAIAVVYVANNDWRIV